jgi:hypothetical protein
MWVDEGPSMARMEPAAGGQQQQRRKHESGRPHAGLVFLFVFWKGKQKLRKESLIC